MNDALHHVGGLDFSIDEIIGADEGKTLRFYRNKAIFAVGHDDSGSTVTGFFPRTQP